MNSKQQWQRYGVWAAVLAVLVGCSGPSSYNTAADPPVAVAHVVGAEPTSATGVDPVAVTVRSKAQVTLTGNASSGGAAAIGNFSWQQTDPPASGIAVKLLYLDSDTVTFTAPALSQDASLHFTLTVTTAGNAAATAHVVVLVKAGDDSNQYLSWPTLTQHSYKVAVSTQEGLGPLASPADSLSDDVPLCITENPTLVYLGRDGAQHSLSLPAVQFDTAWAASIGGAPADFGSFSNPRATFQIPARNQDDVALLFNNPVPNESSSATAARLAQELVPADIDSAYVSITATAGAGPCSDAAHSAGIPGKTLAIQILDQSGNPVGSTQVAAASGAPVTSAVFTPDLLVSQTAAAAPHAAAPTAQYETADTARAYYDAIDPEGAKTTLTAWLNANCFNASAPNYGADAHAVYTNNYDLGFGRDMYFVACKSGSRRGDMASVVLNYPTVEAAASSLHPIIAVAMEYSAATDAHGAGQSRNQRRFPKYYIFAPDDRTGEYRRVLSANFDHRGEKYVPGACVMCHGGALPQFTANFSHPAGSSATFYSTVADPTAPAGNGASPQLGLGDLDSAFMPWDLDSFLYSDTDPTFVGLSVNKSDYTRAAQSANLKALNQLTYCTYQPEIEPTTGGASIDRFASSRRLVAQWYGGNIAADGSTAVDPGCATAGVPTASLLPGAYSDTTVTPAGWTQKTAPGAAGTTSQTSDQIYHTVFVRECRSCHTQDANPKYQFSDYVSFISEFQAVAATPTAPSAPGLGRQYVFQQAKMPLARLTADRFWVDYAGGDSAATVLAKHVQQVTGETDLFDTASQAAVPPGAPRVYLNATGPNFAAPNAFTPFDASSTTIKRFGGVSLDASSSFFAENYSWSLCLVPAVPGASHCASTPLIGSSVATPGFSNSAPGTYQLALIADNGLGASASSTFQFTVPQQKPALATGCPSSVSNSTVATPNSFGPTATQDLSSCIIAGDEPTRVPNTFQILDPVTGTYGAAVSEPSLPWKANATATCSPASAACSYAISFAFSNTAVGDPGTGIVAGLSYRVTDVDGDSATGLLDLLLTDSLTANNATLTTVFQNPTNAYSIPVTNVIVPASDTGATLNVPANFSALPGAVAPPPAGATQFPLGGSAPTPQSALESAITYTPPTSNFLTCDVNGNDLATGTTPCTGDSFWFYLASSGTPTAYSQIAEATIKVKASTSFSRTGTASDVFSIVSNTVNCAQGGCHVPSTPPPTSTDSALADYHWAVTANNASATYDSIKGSNLTYNLAGDDWTVDDANGAPVTTSSLAAFYNNPCDSTSSHYQNNFHLDKASCAIILQWLVEGARKD